MSTPASNYKSQNGDRSETESPYVRAMATSDRRLGLLRTGFRVLLGFGALLVALVAVLVIALVSVTREKQVEIYVVEVDDTGRAVRIDSTSREYEPTEAMIQRAVTDLVIKIRAKPADPIFQRNQWNSAFEMLRGDARGTMNAFGPARAADPSLYVVNVISVVRQTKDTIQVNWNENRVENGATTRSTRWTGIFSYVIAPPETAEAAFQNPLGIFVTAMSWSPEANVSS